MRTLAPSTLGSEPLSIFVKGTSGHDVLRGEAGDDRIFGQAGDDRIALLSGDDSAWGGQGDDTIFGNLGSDLLDGGKGDDDLWAGDRDGAELDGNTLLGGAGDDIARGSGGGDSMSGGEGDDTLVAGGGIDTLDGGLGDDLAILGDDAALIDASEVGAADSARVRFDGVSLELTGIERLRLVGGSGDQTIIGGHGDDFISGGYEGDDRLDGGDGDDVLRGAKGRMTLNGGRGDDQMLIEPPDTFGQLRDWALGTISIDGGAGHDTVRIHSWSRTEIGIAALLDGGVLSGAREDGRLGLSGIDVEALEISAGWGDDTLRGGDGDDTLDASTGYNLVQGRGGDDILTGTGTLSGGAGDDVIWKQARGEGGGEPSPYAQMDGGEGFDLIGIEAETDVELDLSKVDFSAGAVTIKYDFKTISATGMEGVWLIGQGSDETITGSKGDDRIDGMMGADSLFGLEGNDVLVALAPSAGFSASDGDDLYDGGAGVDTISFAAFGGQGYTFAPGGPVTIDLARGVATSTRGFSDTLVSIENAVGGGFNDRLTGDAGANRLDGGAGADRIDGGAGDDIIIGGLGRDTLRGGAGVDRFVYEDAAQSAPGARDLIRAFQHGDVIDIRAIDALHKPGDQAFKLVQAFTGHQGEAVIVATSRGGELQLDIDGDGLADMVISVTGATPSAGDLVL